MNKAGPKAFGDFIKFIKNGQIIFFEFFFDNMSRDIQLIEVLVMNIRGS
jgi:hypothetical protein